MIKKNNNDNIQNLDKTNIKFLWISVKSKSYGLLFIILFIIFIYKSFFSCVLF
jgi:hypothetical protein